MRYDSLEERTTVLSNLRIRRLLIFKRWFANTPTAIAIGFLRAASLSAPQLQSPSILRRGRLIRGRSEKKDWDKLAKFEQAISKKYGKEAVQNPKGNWTDKKEQEYLDQIKHLAEKEKQLLEKDEKVDINGILMPKKLLNRESNRTCPVWHLFI